jgi:DNA-binding transcriptional MerR regulator
MAPGPHLDPSPTHFSLQEAAVRLNVSEATLREWLTNFNWERTFDGKGNLCLSERDIEFLRVIQSLKDVDRSCESIVRIIDGKAESTEAFNDEAAPALLSEEPVPMLPRSGHEEIESLKAELKALHAPVNKKPFWKFW